MERVARGQVRGFGTAGRRRGAPAGVSTLRRRLPVSEYIRAVG